MESDPFFERRSPLLLLTLCAPMSPELVSKSSPPINHRQMPVLFPRRPTHEQF